MNLSFFAKTLLSHDCYRHRLNLPFRYLTSDFPHHSFTLSKADPDPGRDYSAFFTYSVSPPKNAPYFGLWKEKGLLVWCLDDHILDLPPWHEKRITDEERGMWFVQRELADLIVVSTPALAATVDRPAKTLVAPNLSELGRYSPFTGPAPLAEGEKVRVLWTGSDSHLGDLRLIDGAVDRLLRKYGPERVEFYFVGAGPENSLRDWWGRGVRLVDWAPLEHYWNLLAQVRPHLSLAPLVDHPFNRCRSSLRVLEAWATWSPVVASPTGEYRLIESGTDGLFAETEDEWVGQVGRLIEDQTLRHSLARSGRERVERDHCWERAECRGEWHRVVERIEGLAQGT